MPSSRLFIIASLLALGSPAFAVDLESGGPLSDIEVHGFVSQGFIKSVNNSYLVNKSERGSFNLTEVGINFTKTVTDRLRLGVQLFGGGFVPSGAYNAKLDWFYLDYRWRDWLGLRAGRVKLPFGLYNEINDIDSARLPILLPQSTYPVANRNFLLAQTGFELYGNHGFGDLGALEYRLYEGTILIDLAPTPGASFIVRNLDVAYVAGGRLMWETPLEGLRLGGSAQALRLDVDLQGAMNPRDTGKAEIPVILWITSLEYTHNDWLFAAEYSRWHTERSTTNPALLPAQRPMTNERYYALIAWRASHWFQLGSYYAGYYPHYTVRSGLANQQHDFAGTLRFDITSNWLVKLEFHYVRGTAGIGAGLNDGKLANDWGVGLLKTTAYF
jgi:hypothetical protein